jgi:hypothetical protein
VLDFLRIYVLFHPKSTAAGSYAESVSKHFDGLGMERDGVQYRVPVRFRSEAWEPPPGALTPREIVLDEAEHNAIVLLNDEYVLADKAVWDPYLGGLQSAMAGRTGADVLIPFQMASSGATLSCLSRIQHARQDRWAAQLPQGEARTKRLLLHILFCLREYFRKLAGRVDKEALFVSHAKVDGDATARQIIDHVNDSSNDVDISTFYDAKQLMPGEDFQKEFEVEIGRGTLLALVSDIYDTRPWCIYEMTEAKRAGRPIVLADIGKVRVSRTFPYGANVPKVRLASTDAAAIEALLVETLSEALRCDLFRWEAGNVLKRLNLEGRLLPRPPELFDIVEPADLPVLLVYPDPPVGLIEQAILDRALALRPERPQLKTLGELA